MGMSPNNVTFLGFALCFLSLLVFAYGDSHFAVQGQVYCDTCRTQFITKLSYFIKGTKVRLECKNREGGSLTYSAEAETDASGTYNLLVDGEHEEDICEIGLLKSGDPECSEISNDQYLKKTARISLTNNNGIVSGTRVANPLGFMKKEPLPECTEILRELGITPDGMVP